MDQAQCIQSVYVVKLKGFGKDGEVLVLLIIVGIQHENLWMSPVSTEM